jgi:LEA14-like dessication related protein
MTYKKMSRVIGALILAVMCNAAVRAADNKQASDNKKLTLELKSIAFKGFDLANKTADGIATVEVKNPVGAFKLTEVKYKLKLNDHQVAEGKYEKELEIPAGDVTLGLPFTVDMTAIPGVAWNTITDSLTLRYEFETEFTVPLFASLSHTQQSSFKGDLPLGEAFTSLSNRLKEKLFGKP